MRLVYLSGRKGMLVARLDAIAIELRVSNGPAETTRVSSARVDRGVLLANAAPGRNNACSSRFARRLGRNVEKLSET